MRLSEIGALIGAIAQKIPAISRYFFGLVLAVVILTLLARMISDMLKLNPFGKLSYYATRPANRLIGNMRDSRFFYPLRRALGFDPSILMVVIATALVCYVGYTLCGYVTTILWGTANALVSLGGGQMLSTAKYVIGTVLITVISFLLSLMLLVFMNSLFGLLPRLARRAEFRIRPLLNLFEFGGMFAGWSFLILWVALSFAAEAISVVFLDVRTI